MFLTEHFTFDELTATSQANLQELNRTEALGFVGPLKATAQLLEVARKYVGPLYVTSGFRCAAVNGSTPGSSPKSQHMKGEAADVEPYHACPVTDGKAGKMFEVLRAGFKKDAVNFGQLIWEKKNGVEWVHVSLGTPWRDGSRCGEVLVMRDGKYERLDGV